MKKIPFLLFFSFVLILFNTYIYSAEKLTAKQLLGKSIAVLHDVTKNGSIEAKAEVPDIKQGKNKEFTFKAFDILYPGVELPIKEKDLRDDDIADACLLAKLCYLNIEIERGRR